MDDRVEEMDRMRQVISEHMRHSIDTAAHVYLVSECDVTNMVNYVKEQQAAFLEREGFKLTYTPFFVLGAVKAIQSHPKFNASLDGTSVIFKKNINIGMAVAMDKGLMVPVIPNCEELNFLGLCRKGRSSASGRSRNSRWSGRHSTATPWSSVPSAICPSGSITAFWTAPTAACTFRRLSPSSRT